MIRSSAGALLLLLWGAAGAGCAFESDCGCPVVADAGDTAQGPDTALDLAPADTLQPGELSGPCPYATRLGGFTTTIGPEFSFVEGKVAIGVLPSTVPDLVTTEGACTLFRRPSLACQPPCNSQQTCDRGNLCIPFPYNQDLGAVTVKGLAVPVSMNALPPGKNYSATEVPRQLFSPGDHILLDAPATGPFGAFSLDGDGVAPLEDVPTSTLVQENQALTILWTADPDAQGRTQVDLKLTIDQHGSSPLFLECSFPDDGSGTVSASLINQLLQSGVTGYPNGSLTRRSADSVVVAQGCIDFSVYDRKDLTVRVAGHTPCKKQEDCPQGLTCNTLLEMCE
jgi:hypothetical protein